MEEGSIISSDMEKAPRTGEWGFMHPKVDPEKCIGCSTCVPFCPDACIEMRNRTEKEISKSGLNGNKQITEFDLDFCKGCGVCAAVCPVKAITMWK